MCNNNNNIKIIMYNKDLKSLYIFFAYENYDWEKWSFE